MKVREELQDAFFEELAKEGVRLTTEELALVARLFDLDALQGIVDSSLDAVSRRGGRRGTPGGSLIRLRVERRHRTRLRRLAREYARSVVLQRRRGRLSKQRLEAAQAQLKCDIYPICATGDEA